MPSLPKDITPLYTPSTFTLPLRPRPDGSSTSNSGGHYQTLIQQLSSLTIDDYQETPQGDRHVETRRHSEQRVVQTTTTTTMTSTTTTSFPSVAKPRDRDRLLSSGSCSGSMVRFPSATTDTSTSMFNSGLSPNSSSWTTMTSPTRHLGVPRSVSRSVSGSGTGFGGAEPEPSPPSQRYLRTRRGAVSGPSFPGPDHESLSPAASLGSRSSWCSSGELMPGRDYRAPARQQQLLLPAPSSRASGSFASGPGFASGSMMGSDIAGSRAGSTTTATTHRLNQNRLRLSPSKCRANSDHNRNGSQIITDPADFPLPSSSSLSEAGSSSSSRRTVRPTSLYNSPIPPSASSRVCSSISSHNPRVRTGEITPDDSISQIGLSTPASTLGSAVRRREGKQRSSLSLPVRSLPLQGVRHVSPSEVGLSSPQVRPQQGEDRWILPSSTPGRFGPPPPSGAGDGWPRGSSLRDYR
ncbi:hypothetical protein B0T09DRAFT_366813 [Sordaria sp. MPI-SDFR-AT-0083]|nr:hypothetical protein B0T09DRAFT_366813 [Sordaria sp. MPI-SDFR-AT-0083]